MEDPKESRSVVESWIAQLRATAEFNGKLVEEDGEEQFELEPEAPTQADIYRQKDPILFGPRFANADFESYSVYAGAKQQRVKDICSSYADSLEVLDKHNRNCLFMCGNSGTGKNHLAYAIGRRAVRLGKSVEVVPFIDILRQIKSSWGRRDGETEKEIVDRYVNTDFLILEELGISYKTANEKIILFNILDGRYKLQRPTIYTTNLTQEEFREFADFDGKERVWDRILETCVVLHFDWESYRRRREGVA